MSCTRSVALLVLLSGCKNVDLDWPGSDKVETDTDTATPDGEDGTTDSGGADGTGGDDDSGGDAGDDSGGDGGDDAGGDGAGSGSGGDGGTVPDPITATVSGTVTIEVYQVIDGEAVEMDPSEIDSFPYGAIFVGGYDDPAGDGTEVFRGTDTIDAPGFGPNPFEMTVTMDDDGGARVRIARRKQHHHHRVVRSARCVAISGRDQRWCRDYRCGDHSPGGVRPRWLGRWLGW